MGPQVLTKTPVTIAMDGPSGAGKSTQARRLATSLGLAYLDTGAMYRAALCWCDRSGVDLADHAAAVEITRGMQLQITTEPADMRVVLAGQDITEDIRRPEVSARVSEVAVNTGIRELLIAEQRRIIAEARAHGPGIVVEGRDICSVVAPDAEVRILLTASPAERVGRRHQDVRGTDAVDDLAATEAEVLGRDAKDATVADFLTAADGVAQVDSSQRTPDQTHAVLLDVVRAVGVIA